MKKIFKRLFGKSVAVEGEVWYRGTAFATIKFYNGEEMGLPETFMIEDENQLFSEGDKVTITIKKR